MEIDLSEFNQPCDCGMEHHISTRRILIQSGALELIPELLDDLGYDIQSPIAIICDENTYNVAGRQLNNLIPYAYMIVLSSARLYCNEKGTRYLSDYVRKMLARPELFISVGSGTITDVTRYLGGLMDIPMISVPTSASMNGYSSMFSVVTLHGIKDGVRSNAPLAIVADTDIFMHAPYRLTASGYGELLAKYSALLDWRVAGMLGTTHFCPKICQRQMDALNKTASCVDGLLSGDPAAYEQLMSSLIICGLSMNMMENEYPCAGAEHQMAHLWEMNLNRELSNTYHGEDAGVALLSISILYHRLKDEIYAGRIKVHPFAGIEQEMVRSQLGEDMSRRVLDYQEPYILEQIDPRQVELHLMDIANMIGRDLPTPQQIYMMLCNAKCAAIMEDISLSSTAITRTFRLAPYMQNRITVLALTKLMDGLEYN